MAVFAAVVAAALGAFNQVLSSTDALDEVADAGAMARACLQRIAADLSQAHVSLPPLYRLPETRENPDPYRQELEVETVASTSFSRLRFCSLAHVDVEHSGRQGIARIVYYVTEQQDGSFALRRSDRLFPWQPFEPDPADPLLATGVKEFRLTALGADHQEQESWDSEDEDLGFATMAAVKILLTLETNAGPLTRTALVRLPAVRWPKEAP